MVAAPALMANPPALDVALVRLGGFYEFAKLAYARLEGVPLVDGWHVKLICETLQRAACTRTPLDVILNLPPAHGKSSLLSLWQVWIWIEDPAHRFFFGSYTGEMGKREGGKIVALVNSAWFRARWPKLRFVDTKRAFNADPNTAILSTSAGGLRFASTPKGKVTGWHFDTQVIDDPHKPINMGKAAIREVANWLRHTLGTRWRSRQLRVIGMQRLAVNDATAQVLADAAKSSAVELVHIVLPLEADPAISAHYGATYDRREPGELLAPNRFTPLEIAALKLRVGSEAARLSQLQQYPTGVQGRVFRAEWFRQWSTLPDTFDLVGDFWDLTFDDDGADPDYVAGQRWARKGPDLYLIACAPTRRRNFPDTIKAMTAFGLSGSVRPSFTVVEKKANGAAVLSTLRTSVPGLIGYEPRGSKVERASAASVYVESGNTYLPPNAEDLIDVAVAFPDVPHDDEVDTMSMAINYLTGKARAFDAVEGLDLGAILGIS